MSRNPNRGRVYRRCGFRDADGRQLGAGCPALAQRRHGRWTFAVDLPSLDRRRKTTLRRGGFPNQAAARSALHRVLACERAGVHSDDRQTVAEYLAAWIEHKALSLKPTTMPRYRDYITKDLSPALGAIRLEEPTHHHIAAWVAGQLAAGRGPVPSTAASRRCPARSVALFASTACCTTQPASPTSPALDARTGSAGHPPRP